MSSPTISFVDDNGRMDPTHPRAGGPRRRRVFTPAEKLAHLVAYEQACQDSDGGAYLRREGLYSSSISEWRKQRDAGVLDGTAPGEKVGKLTAEQAEIAGGQAFAAYFDLPLQHIQAQFHTGIHR